MVEITDYESAEAWLGTQTHQTQVWFAARCALRAVPGLWAWQVTTESGVAFACLRANLIVAAAASGSDAEAAKLRYAGQAAGDAIFTLEPTDRADASDAAMFAVRCIVAYDTAAGDARLCASVSATAVGLPNDVNGQVTDRAGYAAAVVAATGDIIAVADGRELWGPLWPEMEMPERLAKAWAALKQQWAEDDADWSFWIEWYEAILKGTPMPWELTQRIALEVTPEEWDAGPGVVAKRVAEIRKAWKKEQRQEVNLNEPASAQKASAATRVTQNRDAIVFAVAGLLEQLTIYRERVRGLNQLEPEHREELLSFIDSVSSKLTELLTLFPEESEVIEPEDGGKFIRWVRECKVLIPGVAKRYVEPENVVEAAVPVSVILGCTGIGAMIGGPVGAGAGVVVGGLISKEMKPGQAAKAILDNSSDAPES